MYVKNKNKIKRRKKGKPQKNHSKRTKQTFSIILSIIWIVFTFDLVLLPHVHVDLSYTIYVHVLYCM